MTRGKVHPTKGEYLARFKDAGSEFTADEIEFMLAMEKYTRERHRPFPDARDVLEVAKALGWRKE